MKYKHLEKIRDEISRCVKCAACQAGCPTYEATYSETMAARGKIRLAQGLLEGALKLSDRIENDFNQCLSCLNCAAVCPANVDTLGIFSAIRAEVTETKGLPPVQRFIHHHVLPYPRRLNLLAKLVGAASLVYTWAPRRLAKLFPYAPGGVARVTPDFLRFNLRARLSEVNEPNRPASEGPLRTVAYFSGCMTDLAYPGTGVNVVERLKEAGVKVLFPKAQVCCGAPAYFSGDMETARRLAEENVKVFGALDVDAIVFSCATCASVVSHLYANILPDAGGVSNIAGKVVDFQQLLIQLSMDAAYERMDGAGRKLKVTYHDPCHLRRGMGVSLEPRRLIKSLPRVEFVEMEGADRCCGGAGAFGLNYYDMAVDFGAFKADAIKASGADVVVTACPSCQLQLADALNRKGYDIPIMSAADLIDQVLSKE